METYNSIKQQDIAAGRNSITYRAGGIIICGGKILVVREHGSQSKRTRPTPALYGFPKGAQKDGDITTFDTAVRKIRAELGIELGMKGLVWPAIDTEIISARYRTRIRYHIWMLRECPELDISAGHIAAAEWKTYDELVELRGEMSKPAQQCLSAMGRCLDVLEMSSPRSLLPPQS